MKRLHLSLATMLIGCGLATSVSAKTDATDSLVNNYMRSSLYTILLKSDAQNKYYEEETKKGENADMLMSMAKSLAKTDKKKAANDSATVSVFELPAIEFTTIEIPNQFNDHNLDVRVLDFDALKANITDADKAKYGAKKKKAGFGAFAKSMVGMSSKGDNINADFDSYAPAVIGKFFDNQHVGEQLLAKWYDYNPTAENHWGLGTVQDRGSYNFTEADLAEAAKDPNVRARIEQTAFDMIGNTYVLVTNLRFRSYQAVVAEASAAANAIGSHFGGIGQLAAMGASAATSAATGDGYTVQAVNNLYRLKWNDDVNQKFAVEIYEKNKSLQDLIDANICELEFIGTEKSSSNIRQSLFSDKPISSLVRRATARAIDEGIMKLQTNHEEFRTVLPILGGDGKDVIYAAIGTKEGLNPKDEYEILEKQEDKNGKISYKSVGVVKPVQGKIWNNAFGAAEEVAENDKASDADKAALNYGYSEFKGKKGDYKGYYLRLKKKKK